MPDSLSDIHQRRPAATPQAQRADPRQVQNNAGGYVFKTAETTALRRFLTMGTEGGSFNATAPELSRANAARVIRMAEANDTRLIDEIEDISIGGRAPRVNPAIFALAVAASLGDTQYRQAALDRLPLVCRTGSHLLTFAGYAEQFRGWGRALTKAVGKWYTDKDADEVAYQVMKYKQRDGWSQRDLIRLSHFGRAPIPRSHVLLFDYILKGKRTSMWLKGDMPQLLHAYQQVWHRGTTTAQIARLIGDYNGTPGTSKLTHEMLPSEALASPAVWDALIHTGIPLGTLVKRLGQISRLGILTHMSNTTPLVCARLTNPEGLAKARIHPVNQLVALRTYAQGHGARSTDTWPVSQLVCDALDESFYAAYGAVPVTGLRRNVAVDISGSMKHPAGGLPVSNRELASAAALVTAATEPRHIITAFTHGPYPSYWTPRNGMGSGISEYPISPRMRLDDVMRTADRMQMGGTNCAVPMLEALKHQVPVDVFEIHTDNETWYGGIHPHQALEDYRQGMGIDAKLAVVAYTPTDFTIADPADWRTLDVSGFDQALPQLLADFASGGI
jgi:60 kDa SS-A/Ro ribonucleoprotein